MSRLLIFNPSNDMALAAGVRQYLPPKAIQEMEKQMADFPKTYADEDDVILTDWSKSYEDMCRKAGKRLIPSPWGWSLAIKQRLLRIGVPETLMPTDAELQQWRMLSSRQTAADYISQLLRKFHASPNSPHLVGHHMQFHDNIPEYYPEGTWMFKSPWSSSGRGVFAGTYDAQTINRLRGYLRKQGGFLADRFYQCILDCALEFQLDKEGNICFLGYSVFNTLGNGRYGSNFIESNEQLLNRIVHALGNTESAHRLLLHLVSYHLEALQKLLGGIYYGPVGIDMMVVKGETSTDHPCLHPCIEINLRMNMGIAALLQYRKTSSE